MQFNQPFGKPTFDSRPYSTFYQTSSIPLYSVIGEGEVNSVFIPDGSVQMYFIPTFRYDRWPPYPYINNFNKDQSTESWFIRSITLPVSSSLTHQYPNLNGDRLSTQLLSPDYNSAIPFCTEFCQKFHNDNATSTTDIIYFYPSLRQNKILLNNALVQTSTPTENYNVSYNDGNRQCNCKVSFRIEKEMNRCLCRESASAMSVDSVKDKSSDQSIDKKHRLKHKRKSRRRKGRDHTCECKVGVKSTSDKLVTTYNDRACGNDSKEGRDTQTKKSKRSDIKTEIWVPVKGKTKKSKSKSPITSREKLTCGSDSACTCSSTSNTDTR